ncbi:LacI family transcriptional regulator [Actinotalea sp. M2MS4P-6]|uniref:LacI family DNA-binding transcriptional regulator n=1 Tax=Actinotalea sp. M2MS4P-6 TaxID=2983762 RepID=UPI0021E3E3F4|nr:LacI family DNA-binding transcriptional regulator [Actinotalea sp. M2MS4P-6]MCV2394430.1 LacI family transcriptional regulator [Actinotalea sp. M2MS4P-6]
MATLKDVAAAAGVSPATASRALSEPGSVATAGRERVLRAAAQLGYRVNPAARALRSGRSGHLGLVLPDLANPFFASVAKGVQARARELGRTVLVADTEEDPALELDLVARLREQVDGVILCSSRMPESQLRSHADAGRVVLVNRELDGVPSVSVDNADGVRQGLEHLRALGHRTVAYAGGPASSWSDQRRREAFAAVEGITVVDLGPGRPVAARGVAAADLALGSAATAVVAYNDLVALGVLDQLRTRGVRVPEEMSVIGFDDIPAAALVHPPLTTVTLPLREVGRRAVELVVATADADPSDPPAVVRELLGVELVVRGSTAPAAAGAARSQA